MNKKTICIFPGQGSQYVGMGKSFYDSYAEARHIFEHSEDILQTNLRKIIFEGPEGNLKETKNSQPAIYVTSYAILHVLTKKYNFQEPIATGGLSLGEYTALAAANSCSFEDGLRLVQRRAQLMHDACESTKGTMAAVMGLSDEVVIDTVASLQMPNDIWCANFNCPGQVVISGTFKGIEAARQPLLDRGAKRVLNLEVHGAFHSGLMKSAEQELALAINDTSFAKSFIPTVSNVTGTIPASIDEMKKLLLKQLTSSVRWTSCIKTLDALQPDYFVEIGCGTTLQGMNKRINPQAPTLSIEKPENIENLLKTIS